MNGIKILLLFIVLFLSVNAYGQNAALSQEYLEQADLIYREQKEAIEIAKELYVLAVEADTNNVKANWMAGTLYLETIPKDNSLQYFQRVKRLDRKFRFDIDYFIGSAYQHGLDFDNALKHFEDYRKKYMSNPSYRGRDRTYIASVDRKIKECKNGKEIVGRPSRYSVHQIGREINSEWPDYAPMVNSDETLMIFTSRRSDGNTSPDVDKDNFYFEDIFYSEKVNGKWTEAKNIGAPINTAYHDANISLSFDDKRLYLYKDENMGDLYYSDYINGAWTEPQRMSSRINSTTYAERSITETSDPEVIIYSSDRPGGEGGLDLYMISKNDKGDWYKTKSLGPVINTRDNEDSPFLLHDGKTLYFSSNGHKGYGGWDIFKSVYDSASGQWSEPENLGYPVNTPDNEVYFTATKDGEQAYYASVREEGFGYTDIFMIKLHSELREAVPSKLLASAKSNTAPDHNFGGLPKEIFESVETIFFEVDNFKIRKEFLPLMDSIIEITHQHPEIIIDISGYSSIDGNPRYNIELSNKRAFSVSEFLLRKGVKKEQISAKGYGAIDEFADKEKNRRADIKLHYIREE